LHEVVSISVIAVIAMSAAVPVMENNMNNLATATNDRFYIKVGAFLSNTIRLLEEEGEG